MTAKEAPPGASWETIKSKAGEFPVLVWKEVPLLLGAFTDTEILNMVNGQSLGASYRGLAKRALSAGKSQDEIADAILAYRPEGSVTKSAVRETAEAAISRAGTASVAALLAKVANGEISVDEDGNIS